MSRLERRVNPTMPCCKCGRLKKIVDLEFDRHEKHYCTDCAAEIELCELCGSTKLDDTTIHGQLHYEDWCFK